MKPHDQVENNGLSRDTLTDVHEIDRSTPCTLENVFGDASLTCCTCSFRAEDIMALSSLTAGVSEQKINIITNTVHNWMFYLDTTRKRKYRTHKAMCN